MSLYGALFSGVSGLNAFAQGLGIISDNITNVNTVGYKRFSTQFSTLVTRPATETAYTPGGVQSLPRPLIDQQGLLQPSASSTDIAITGNGFFVVNDEALPTSTNGTYLYTRAGNFTPDKDGNLVNASGYYLQGYRIDSEGNIPTNTSDLSATETVNLRGLTGSAEPTTMAAIRANLQSSQTINANIANYDPTDTANNMANGGFTPDFERSIEIFDSKGGARTVTFGFLKATTPNQWFAEVYVEPASSIQPQGAFVNGQIGTGTIAFNTDGTYDEGNTTITDPATIVWATALGLANSSIDFNFGTDNSIDGMTQFDSVSILTSTDVNGTVVGSLVGVNIDPEGTVIANFDNGLTRAIYLLPLATFANTNGLQSRTGNVFIPTDKSSNVNLQLAGRAGAGLIQESTLEASTVDLAKEFTDLIIIQRSFTASTRIVTTADEMLEELVRIKR